MAQQYAMQQQQMQQQAAGVTITTKAYLSLDGHQRPQDIDKQYL